MNLLLLLLSTWINADPAPAIDPIPPEFLAYFEKCDKERPALVAEFTQRVKDLEQAIDAEKDPRQKAKLRLELRATEEELKRVKGENCCVLPDVPEVGEIGRIPVWKSRVVKNGDRVFVGHETVVLLKENKSKSSQQVSILFSIEGSGKSHAERGLWKVEKPQTVKSFTERVSHVLEKVPHAEVAKHRATYESLRPKQD